jgi:hypothetical protein
LCFGFALACIAMASRLWGKKAHKGALLEADEEELAEQRLHNAAKSIQRAYRARRARKSLRAMVKANFVKEYDRHVSLLHCAASSLQPYNVSL